ncbi:MAG: 50S ribosomal protein L6 [Deltaproteobacteria bacterium]|nr:50S ribosomal protein L6 [Deltaproteobacteria bacterium]
MSRVGKRTIPLPKGVSVEVVDRELKVKGPKGELKRPLPPGVTIASEGGAAKVSPLGEARSNRALHGLARALLNNMVTGVSKGFSRELEINGVGYRAEAKKGLLTLALGYSHPIEVFLPQGVEAKVDKNKIELTGIDREVLGQLAAVIRGQRPPEPYKGKGIKYVEETIRRKVGKAGAG